MNFIDMLINPEAAQVQINKISGVVVGIVTNNQDPEGMGRVKVNFPWLNDEDESAWARVATLMAGNGRGIYFLPEVEDEVLVAFEHGDLSFPYVIGSLWNGKDATPAKNDDGKNNLRLIKSRSGHTICLNDEDGKEKIEIVDKSGKNCLVFDTANNTITITSDQDINLSAAQGTIKLEAQNIEIKSSVDTMFEANSNMNIKGATVNIN
jgi:uncharacterized protein involved in type VI secretion and phage assembly